MTMQHRDGNFKIILLPILALSSLGFLGVAMHFLHQKRSKRDKKLVPLLQFTESGHARRLERFSHYVARQMGFGGTDDCPNLCKLADDYLKKSKGCEENIFNFFSNEENAESLYSKLIEELDICILSYFAFHWSQASLTITQALSVESEQKMKLKNVFMAATRKQRFDRVSNDLKVTRLFSTLVVEMKAIGHDSRQCTEVMVPIVHCDRSPILLLMGGGMGAGKSTVLKDILKEPLWSTAAEPAVVVEADAFKETDVIYKALNSKGHHDMLQTAELVHQSSIEAASSLLVTALNEGRDVIMDGTLSWVPFVEQTISMARNVHRRRYRMGIGYKVSGDGSVMENYWEEDDQEQADCKSRKPYRIELVGVVCDAYLAVVRGIRRAILTGRAVRVKSQLKSHKMFATAFPRYSQLVDRATLYSTDDMGKPAQLIAWKDGDYKMLVDPDKIDYLKRLSMLNEDAECMYDLYPCMGSSSGSSYVWSHVVESPSRATDQQELKIAIAKIENPKSHTQAKWM